MLEDVVGADVGGDYFGDLGLERSWEVVAGGAGVV